MIGVTVRFLIDQATDSRSITLSEREAIDLYTCLQSIIGAFPKTKKENYYNLGGITVVRAESIKR